MVDKNIIVSVIVLLMVVVIIVLVLMFGFQKTNEQFYELCSQHNWEGSYNFSGELSGTINCTEQRINLFTNGEWKNECSTFPFSFKPSCHTLCNYDCEIYNKLNNDNRCVC